MSGSGDFQPSGGVGVQEQGSSGISPASEGGIPTGSGQAVQSQPGFPSGAPTPGDEVSELDEATLARISQLGWKKPEDFSAFQSAKDREIQSIREQVIGFQQQARSAALMAQQWEQQFQKFAEEAGDENRYKLTRADLMEQYQQVQGQEQQRFSHNADYLQGTLKAATGYVLEHAVDASTGQRLFEPNDPEIRSAINEVMMASREQLMAQDQGSQGRASQNLDAASAKVRQLVRARETAGYRKLYGTQAAEQNRQQHQQNGRMVTPTGGAVGSGGGSLKDIHTRVQEANPGWSAEKVYETALAEQIASSLQSQG